MATNEEIIARNTENLRAMINGDVDTVRVAGVVISLVDVAGYKYRFRVGDGLQVYGDELEITTSFAYLRNEGIMCAFLPLMEE